MRACRNEGAGPETLRHCAYQRTVADHIYLRCNCPTQYSDCSSQHAKEQARACCSIYYSEEETRSQQFCHG